MGILTRPPPGRRVIFWSHKLGRIPKSLVLELFHRLKKKFQIFFEWVTIINPSKLLLPAKKSTEWSPITLPCCQGRRIHPQRLCAIDSMRVFWGRHELAVWSLQGIFWKQTLAQDMGPPIFGTIFFGMIVLQPNGRWVVKHGGWGDLLISFWECFFFPMAPF